jgi:hypothetical protein
MKLIFKMAIIISFEGMKPTIFIRIISINSLLIVAHSLRCHGQGQHGRVLLFL